MHTSYITSIRCKSSLSFSLSDYTSYIDDRFHRYPITLSSQPCCSCCGNSINRIPINPSFLCGLRQSTLIQWSPSRRLILGGAVQSYPRFPICDTDPNRDYQKSHSSRERSGSGTRGRWRKGNYHGCMSSEERGKTANSCYADDAELMLSLLTEEVSEECLGVRGRNSRGRKGRSARIAHVEKRENRIKKNNVGSSGLESTSKCNYQLVESRSKEGGDIHREEERTKQDRENQNFKAKKEGSSCSSYYSLSSMDEIESDNEVQNKEDRFVGDLSSEYKRNQKMNEEILYDGKFEENIRSRRDSDYNEEQGIRLEKKDSATNRVECDWRKKSEKKLTEVSIEQEESKTESSQKLFSSSEMSKNHNAQKRESKSSTALRIDEGKREKSSEVSDNVNRQSQSKMKYNQIRETELIQSNVNKASSSSEKQYRGRVDYKSGEYEGISQQLAKASEIQVTDSTDNTIEHGELGQQVTRKMNSRRKSQQIMEISDTHDVNTENTITSQSRSETRIKKQEEASSSYQEAKEQHPQTDAKAIRRRLESRIESHDIITDADNVTISGHDNIASSEEKGRTSSPRLQLEIHGGSNRDGTHMDPSTFISHEDALNSADKSQKFATHFVNEFVEKARNEISLSEIQKIASETKIVHEENKQSGFQSGSGDSQPKDRDSRRSSRNSGAKGPSDEMWAVNNPSLTTDEPPQTEAPEGSAKEVVRRSGRTMWGMMSDIIRMRWGPQSETRSSRSGERSSPNQSMSSEAWFSGHEHNENGSSQSADQQEGAGQSQRETSSEGELLYKGKSTSSTEETSAEHLEGSFGTEISRPTAPLPAIRMRRSPPVVEEIAGSTSGAGQSQSQRETSSEGELLSKGKSTSSTEETSAEHLEGSFGTEISRPTAPLPAIRMRRSPPVIEEIGGSTSGASGNGTSLEMKEVLGTESKDGEVKRRKLQRNKQVPKDRFDEWEEAFVVENEQRKMDEMFMKEALLEAKKAGDMWEVPVGAVLVQHGKIIARGYNLVEELRDSTAHAEMICIREASNVLQSWRLSETTLYVTLEPCPMCAGAILQARVDTVVWGAPNKLLGADGSWIRLFPNGGEEGNGSEETDKPSAPVHPFHPKMKVRRGVLASECGNVMQEFFQLRRRKKEKKTEQPPTPPPSCLPISNHRSKLFTKMHNVFNITFCL